MQQRTNNLDSTEMNSVNTKSDVLFEALSHYRPTLIAELHPQHQGRLELLKEMMFSAKESGVDLCKIQIYGSERTLGSENWKYLEYKDRDLDEIFYLAEKLSISLFASVFSLEDFTRIQGYDVPAYKIASRTVKNRDLCLRMLETGKPVICSLGAWDSSSLPFDKSSFPNLFYLDCVSKYPTPIEDTGYAFRNFSGECIDGISDHSVGPAVSLAAIAHGARIVERHMSMTKYRWADTERGHICSSDPDEWRLLRTIGDRIALARELSSCP